MRRLALWLAAVIIADFSIQAFVWKILQHLLSPIKDVLVPTYFEGAIFVHDMMQMMVSYSASAS